MTDTLSLSGIKAKTTSFSRSKNSGSIGIQIPFDDAEERDRILNLLPNGRHDVTLEEEQDDESMFEEDVARYSGVGDFHSASVSDVAEGTISGRLSFRDEDAGFGELMHLANRDVKLTAQRTGTAGEEPSAPAETGDPPDTGGEPLPYGGEQGESDEAEASGEDGETKDTEPAESWRTFPIPYLTERGLHGATANKVGETFPSLGQLADAVDADPSEWWKQAKGIGRAKARAIEHALAQVRAKAHARGNPGTPLSTLDAYGLPPLVKERLMRAGFRTIEEVEHLDPAQLTAWDVTGGQQDQMFQAVEDWRQDQQQTEGASV